MSFNGVLRDKQEGIKSNQDIRCESRNTTRRGGLIKDNSGVSMDDSKIPLRVSEMKILNKQPVGIPKKTRCTKGGYRNNGHRYKMSAYRRAEKKEKKALFLIVGDR
jgi:hypothetical protein